MRWRILLGVTVLLLGGVSGVGFAQGWDQLHAGSAEAVTVMSDGTIVLLSGAATYRSTDGGATWVEGGAAPQDVTIIREGPFGSLYATQPFGQGGVNRSTDKGDSWQVLSDVSSWDVAFDSQGDILVATEGSYILRSSDNGGTWAEQTIPEAGPYFWSVAVDANDWAYAGSQGEGVFRSQDNGATWSSLMGGEQAIVEGVTIAEDGTIYVAKETGLNVSTDNGASWEEAEELDGQSVGKRLVVHSSGTVYAASSVPFGASSTVSVSTDQGESWQSMQGNLDVGFINAIALDAQGRLYVAGANGLYVLENLSSVAAANTGAAPAYSLRTIGVQGNAELWVLLDAGTRLTAGAFVQITDITGRDVHRVSVAGFAAGQHRLNVLELGLPAGIYFCQLIGPAIEVPAKAVRFVVW